MPSDAGVDLRSARLAQGLVALALGLLDLHLDARHVERPAAEVEGVNVGGRGQDRLDRVDPVASDLVVEVGERRRVRLVPIDVAARDHAGRRHGTLMDNATRGLVPGDLDGAVEERLVGNDASRLDAA